MAEYTFLLLTLQAKVACEAGGKDLADLVTNVITTLVQNKLQRQINMTGAHNKMKLDNTRLLQTIISKLE